jgi:hypothetical protein
MQRDTGEPKMTGCAGRQLLHQLAMASMQHLLSRLLC